MYKSLEKGHSIQMSKGSKPCVGVQKSNRTLSVTNYMWCQLILKALKCVCVCVTPLSSKWIVLQPLAR